MPYKGTSPPPPEQAKCNGVGPVGHRHSTRHVTHVHVMVMGAMPPVPVPCMLHGAPWRVDLVVQGQARLQLCHADITDRTLTSPALPCKGLLPLSSLPLPTCPGGTMLPPIRVTPHLAACMHSCAAHGTHGLTFPAAHGAAAGSYLPARASRM